MDLPTYPGWNLIRMLGKGCYGTVYEIERDSLGIKEKSALKIIKIPESEADIDMLRSEGYDDDAIKDILHNTLLQIAEEYKVMEQLKGNQHIVRCDDFQCQENENGFGWTVFIRMELLTPLPTLLGTNKIRTNQYGDIERLIIKIGSELCAALCELEKRKIVHRDIKLQNIFVSDDGIIKLGDLGLAVNDSSSGDVVVGTTKYIPPEVIYNRHYSASSDIYSLGITLYCLMNEKRMPFLPLPPEPCHIADEEAAIRKRLSGEPLPKPKYGSKALQAIILKACKYKTEERYSSARDMLVDFYKLVTPKKQERLFTTSELSPEQLVLLIEAANHSFVETDWDYKPNKRKTKIIVASVSLATAAMIQIVLSFDLPGIELLGTEHSTIVKIGKGIIIAIFALFSLVFLLHVFVEIIKSRMVYSREIAAISSKESEKTIENENKTLTYNVSALAKIIEKQNDR